MVRPIRIIGTAAILAFLFRMSQQLTAARGEDQVPGYTVAIAVVGFLFLVRAAASEFASDKVGIVQRDILWGLSLGAFVSMLARLTT
jgi:hypothetical protein